MGVPQPKAWEHPPKYVTQATVKAEMLFKSVVP